LILRSTRSAGVALTVTGVIRILPVGSVNGRASARNSLESSPSPVLVTGHGLGIRWATT